MFFLIRIFLKLLWRFFFLALIFLFIWIFLSVNDRQRDTYNAPPARPLVDPNARADSIFIDKSDRTLQLLQNGALLREYKIALGFAPEGDKRVEGDGKTPIGDYVIDWRNDQSSFYRSLHISYPRPDQIELAEAEGRAPGGLIMIHGQPNQSEFQGEAKINADWTNGCIAVSNAEMDEIWALVPDGAQITITE